jgi:hypothetical protein
MNFGEERLIRKALDAFKKVTDFDVEYQTGLVGEKGFGDGLIRIEHQGLEWFFIAEAKRRINRAVIGMVAQQFFQYDEKGLLVVRYVTPQLADQLKELDIPFIDTVGNAYVNVPPIFIFVKGNKPTEELRQDPLNRTFKVRGLQVLFALLCNPGLENRPLREIAREADVALGTVQWVLKDLKTMGYLVDMGKRGRKLVRKENLLKRWVTAYPEQLRPKQLIRRFRAEDREWWKKFDLKQYQAYWGGEVAASILTQYLKPEVVTIYTNQPIGRLVLKNRLKRDPNGKIEILNAFWNFEQRHLFYDTVHPILVYADLMATGDSRAIEVAKVIYENEIAQIIPRD